MVVDKRVVALVQDLVDTHVFLAAKGVLDSLNRHDCSAALAWCEENRPRLRKLKSKLEFTLRVQVPGAVCTCTDSAGQNGQKRHLSLSSAP